MSNIRQKGVPTRKTVGSIGDIYTDTNTGLSYKCTDSYGVQTHIGMETMYEWKQLPGEKNKPEVIKKQEPVKQSKPKVEEVKEEPKVEETKTVVEKDPEVKEEPKQPTQRNYNKYYKNNK